MTTIQRIVLKSDRKIDVYTCSKTKYLETSGKRCSYSKKQPGYYNSFYDGYCIIHKQNIIQNNNLITKTFNCGFGMRVYDLNPEEINMMWDPLDIYGASNSSTYYGDCKKIK